MKKLSEEDPVQKESRGSFRGVKIVKEEFFRSGGPGGQNVNKVETGVRLRAVIEDHKLLERLKEFYSGYFTTGGEMLVESTKHRTREQNRQNAYDKFEKMLGKAREERKERIATKTPRAVNEKRVEAKRRRGQTKQLRKKPERW